MRLPNKYGTVYKLTGKRRRPWVAKKMIGKIVDMESMKVHHQYLTIGYYEKRTDALSALAAYNSDPYDPVNRAKTLREVYDAWSVEYFPKLKSSGNYKAAWKVFEPLYEEPMSNLKLDHYQSAFQNSGKNSPTLQMAKIMLSLMYDYAIIHEIVPADKKNFVTYLDPGKNNPRAIKRTIFTQEEINELWQAHEPIADTALILIYTGLRISELMGLTSKHVDFGRQSISVTSAKTKAGIREVPIADKILPLMQAFIEEHPTIAIFRDRLMNVYHHRPHDTRHTFATLMTEKNVDQRMIDALLGHSAGTNTALNIYTHITLEEKLKAVNIL